MILKCRISPPVVWDRSSLEASLQLVLPPDVIALWDAASEIVLHEDVTYGQWGCCLWSPREIVERQKEVRGWRDAKDFRDGDLIIGDFRGDSDLVLVRCDPHEPDFGAVVIASALDPRQEWPVVASSILGFIEKFVANPECKFWENELD